MDEDDLEDLWIEH